MLKKISLSLAMAAVLASGAAADEAGHDFYLEACATCHGETGNGDGPLAELMKITVPALTGLSAANEGVFPMLDVIHVIDGRQSVRGHGNPMPVWGKHFEIQADVDGHGPYGSEAVVRGRILSIAYYLESIQK